MKITITASIISCLGKSVKLIEDITNLNDVEFISKETNMKESQKEFTLRLNNDLNLDKTKTSLNYLIAKHNLKDSIIIIRN